MTTDLNTLREALEPCPFCGGAATLHGSNEPAHIPGWFVECLSCGVSNVISRKNDSGAEAIAAWNRRAPRLEAAAAAEYERGRQDGMKQEHALWKLAQAGQEIEAATVPELSREDVVRLAREAGIEFQTNEGLTGRVNMSTRGSQKIEKIERFASLVRSVPVGEVKPVEGVVLSDGAPVFTTRGHEDAYIAKWGGSRLYTTPPAPPEGWRPIETAPKDGRKMLLCYNNSNGMHRTVVGGWVTDEEAAETDADGVGLEAGWYERIDNWDDYYQVAIHEGEPTHWMPLPAAPQPGDKP